MFVLVSYDAAAGRTEKFRRLLSRYLVHEQNSVFCGLLGQPDLRALEASLNKELTNADKVLILVCENRLNINVTRLGIDDGNARVDRKSVVL